jgi:hypothetical protein
VVFLIVNGWCHPERALRESKNPGNTRGLSTSAAAASAQDDKKSGVEPKNAQTLSEASLRAESKDLARHLFAA